LLPGSQAVQASHAIIKFVFEHPQIANNWYNISQYLVELSVNNQEELLELVEKLKWKDISFSEFREPDLDNELTAIALEPSEKARRVVSSMPLLLSEYNEQHKKEFEYKN
jgi:peptidyl-tRNA hydrolase